MNDRLYRSRDERVIAGVAGGLAERFDLDPSLVRIGWVLLALVSGGIFLLIYIVMAIVVPEAPVGADRWAGWPTTPPGPGAVPGWAPPASEPTTGGAAAAAFVGGAAVASGDTGPGAAVASGDASPGAAGTTDASPGAAGPGPTPPPTTPPPWAVPPPRPRRHEGGGSGAIVGGIILVLIGGYFLLRQFFPDLNLGAYWPVILIILGVALLIGSIRRGPREPGS